VEQDEGQLLAASGLRLKLEESKSKLWSMRCPGAIIHALASFFTSRPFSSWSFLK
jgi:hypothetical protein